MTRSLLFILLFPTTTLAQSSIPPGTILPVQLESSISSEKSKPDDAIRTRIMQDVPLPDGGKIPRRSIVLGRVKDVSAAASGQGGRITIVFDKVKSARETSPVTTDLRALASMMEVDSAQTVARVQG